jgi:hypothetical protein
MSILFCIESVASTSSNQNFTTFSATPLRYRDAITSFSSEMYPNTSSRPRAPPCVEQRRGDLREVVCGAHEEHTREVDGHVHATYAQAVVDDKAPKHVRAPLASTSSVILTLQCGYKTVIRPSSFLSPLPPRRAAAKMLVICAKTPMECTELISVITSLSAFLSLRRNAKVGVVIQGCRKRAERRSTGHGGCKQARCGPSK